MVPCVEMLLAAGLRHKAAIVALLLGLTGCLRSYELSLGGNKNTASHSNDADAGSALSPCDSDDDCAGRVQRTCDSELHVCYECQSNSDCQERPGLSHCNLKNRTCEGCTEDVECQQGMGCDREARACTTRCTGDRTCGDPARPSCQGGLCRR
jgi:hypothetical protein